jgi:hypothetical protein
MSSESARRDFYRVGPCNLSEVQASHGLEDDTAEADEIYVFCQVETIDPN